MRLLLLLLLVSTAFSKHWCPPDTGADAAFAFAFAGIAPDTGADAACAVEAAATVARERTWLVDLLLARVQVLAKHAGSGGLSAKHAEKVVKP